MEIINVLIKYKPTLFTFALPNLSKNLNEKFQFGSILYEYNL